MIHQDNGTRGLGSWDSWCYAPIAAATAVVMMAGSSSGFFEKLNSIGYAQAIAALAPWRRDKEVFVMDEGLQELLSEQADDLKLDSETLLHLPYTCFYIQFNPALEYNGEEYHGVFVHLESNPESKARELRLLYLRQDGQTMGVPIHIGAGTIEESLKMTYRSAFNNLSSDQDFFRKTLEKNESRYKEQADFYRQTMQMVLYILAENAEITPNPEQETHTKRSYQGTIKDRYSEIRKWDVGVKTGNAVRAYRKRVEAFPETESGTHASPRPHMRRGHWHHFWIGRKDVPSERKIVLRWVAPTFVGIEDTGNTPVVIHDVLSKEEQ